MLSRRSWTWSFTLHQGNLRKLTWHLFFAFLATLFVVSCRDKIASLHLLTRIGVCPQRTGRHRGELGIIQQDVHPTAENICKQPRKCRAIAHSVDGSYQIFWWKIGLLAWGTSQWILQWLAPPTIGDYTPIIRSCPFSLPLFFAPFIAAPTGYNSRDFWYSSRATSLNHTSSMPASCSQPGSFSSALPTSGMPWLKAIII